MKTRSFITVWVVGCMLASVVLLAGASSAQATFIYDFEGLNTGRLAPQDGWVNTSGSYHANVTDDSTTANGTKVVRKDGHAYRPIPTQSFTVMDMAVMTVWLKPAGVGGITAQGYFGASTGAQNDGLNVWVRGQSGGDRLEISYGGGGHLPGTTMPTTDQGDWLEVKVVVDFSVAGGSASVSYRNITDGGSWTTDPLLQNVAMGFTTVNGVYVVDNASVWVTGSGGYIDNLSLTSVPIPEPGTLALLATGLIGLLCYAWRKRR